MKTCLSFLFLWTTTSLLACAAAGQTRLFPLGMSPQGLVVVEMHIYRGDGGGRYEMNAVWGGESYLNIYDKQYRLVSSERLADIPSFNQSYGKETLKNAFKQGFEKAQKIPGLVAAQPISIGFCDYRKECSMAQLLTDSSDHEPSVVLEGKPYAVPVIFDTASFAGNYVKYHMSFAGGEDFSFLEGLSISSVRKFRIGKEVLSVVHLGDGQKLTTADGTVEEGKEYAARFPFRKLKESTFEEPVLYHGHGFDFFVIQ